MIKKRKTFIPFFAGPDIDMIFVGPEREMNIRLVPDGIQET